MSVMHIVFSGAVAGALALGAVAASPAGAGSIVKKPIPVPDGVAASANGARVWLVSDVDGTVYKFTRSGAAVGRPIKTGSPGTSQHIDAWTPPSGKRGYFLDEDDTVLRTVRWGSQAVRSLSVAVPNSQPTALTGGVVHGVPVALVLNVGAGGGSVTVVNRSTWRVVGHWRLPSAQYTEPNSFALSPNGRMLYVGNYSGANAAVWVISTAKRRVVRTLRTAYPGTPGIFLEVGSIAVDPGGQSLFIGASATGPNAGTYKVDAVNGRVITRHLVSTSQNFVTVATAGGRRVVAVSNDAMANVPPPGTLQVLKRSNLQPVGDPLTVPPPSGLAAASAGQTARAFVTSGNGNAFWIVPFPAGVPTRPGNG